MNRIVRYRAKARSDLLQIGAYGRREWGTARSRDYLLEIARRVAQLAENPFLGPDAALRPADLCKLKAGHHPIFYLVRDDEIEVVRVLHERMEIRDNFDR